MSRSNAPRLFKSSGQRARHRVAPSLPQGPNRVENGADGGSVVAPSTPLLKTGAVRCSTGRRCGCGLTFASLLLAACGGSTERVGSTSAQGGGEGGGASAATGGETLDSGTGGATSATDGESIEFVIPLSPRDEGALSFLLVEDETTGEATPDGEPVVRLAVGEGYPDTMLFELSSLLLLSDLTPLAATEFTIEAATPDGVGVEAIVAGNDVLELSVHEPGTYSVELDLAAAFEAGSATQDFRVEVSVLAIQVAGAEWSTCTGPLYLVSGSPMGSSRLYPLEKNGNPFAPRNTAFDRGADIIVSARAGTRIEAPAGLDSLVVTGPSQTIQVRSNYGEVAAFELVQAEQVDSISPSFQSDQGGARGGGTSLRSGGEHAVDLTAAPYISVFPGARIGGEIVCGGPDEALFELRSTTPEVCSIQRDGCAVRGCLTGRYVPAIANIIAAGTCNLELEAPTLDHGNGLSASFSVEIKAL